MPELIRLIFFRIFDGLFQGITYVLSFIRWCGSMLLVAVWIDRRQAVLSLTMLGIVQLQSLHKPRIWREGFCFQISLTKCFRSRGCTVITLICFCSFAGRISSSLASAPVQRFPLVTHAILFLRSGCQEPLHGRWETLLRSACFS